MEWFNISGLVFLSVIIIPNIIFFITYKDGFENQHIGRGIQTLEQMGRIGCFVFMVFNIPGTYLGCRSDETFKLYLAVNAVLAALYCLIWIICFKKSNMFRALSLSLIPSVIFIFSGIITRSLLLTAAALLFAPCHIMIALKNAK